ncbi:cupin domain-containing protein [Deinococcus sp. KNUC1210]|uniref:cupin domain-containing protein n=1 Tax=Deinococcus sp. KNUC1210 TaxID=2917691 RepID=UPI001EF0A983|nr:cupin domain-containing protein [Deinococcus sp. KNUC1210]ULH16591.1 cupin domain-containing protein [Deinococcus sp. KNUC1210]
MTSLRLPPRQPTETPNGNTVTALATPSLGANDVSVIRQRQRPGGFNPPHFHDREELTVLLEGRVSVSMNGEQTALEAGDTLLIPASVLHAVENTGDTDAEWLIVSAAGIRFFSEAGVEMQPGWAR